VTLLVAGAKVGPAAGPAQEAAEAAADELAAQAGKKPTMVSAAVSQKTGATYLGTSAEVPDSLHPEILARSPHPSLEPWRVSNCAEFNACNKALNAGEQMTDLEIHTVRVKTGVAEEACKNCKFTTAGARVTSDGVQATPAGGLAVAAGAAVQVKDDKNDK
jgi:hypothetical protein